MKAEELYQEYGKLFHEAEAMSIGLSVGDPYSKLFDACVKLEGAYERRKEEYEQKLLTQKQEILDLMDKLSKPHIDKLERSATYALRIFLSDLKSQIIKE
jgi:hypothetical protein